MQLAAGGDGRCSSAMQVTVESVELLGVLCAADTPGTQAALDHIVRVDPASQGVSLQQVRSLDTQLHSLACGLLQHVRAGGSCQALRHTKFSAAPACKPRSQPGTGQLSAACNSCHPPRV